MNSASRLLLALLFAGCVTPDDHHRHPASVSPTAGADTTAPPAAKPAPAAEPTAKPNDKPTDKADPSQGKGTLFSAEPGWIVETPTSAMRKAQFLLPHAEGDREDASLVVFHFGSQAGTREANVERWTSQFEQTDGRPSSEAVKTSARTLDGREIFDVELAGTYVAETSPGSGERVRKEGWRMLASILETKDGAYYVKLVGPAATVARWEPSYRKFVEESSTRLR